MSQRQAPLLLPVILSGGSGTRLWPLSRESYPKQFHALVGERTMLQDTALRLAGLPDIEQAPGPMVVCNSEHRFMAAEQLRAMGVARPEIVLEPVGRNTAPALTLAALLAQRDGADPVLLVMPSDHVIADTQAFHEAVAVAYRQAADGAMLTFGIVPTRPETGYGYIHRGTVATQGVHPVLGFAEKPDVETAQRYLRSGDYLWNSGLFMVRASVWKAAIGHCRPDILVACQLAVDEAHRDLDFVRPHVSAFEACPSDSIDYAVLERLPQQHALGIPTGVVPLDAGWSDLGAWDALLQALPHDAHGNALRGDAIAHDCHDTLLLSTGRLVAGIGLQGMAVIETPDAVLVAPQDRVQDVKALVGQLRQGGRQLIDTHRKAHRPWGWYDCIDAGQRFQVKRIVVKPGASLSLQKHHHRAEHWIVVSGTAEVTNGDKTFLLGENESTYIPLGHVHRLSNPGKVPLELIEVQSGSYLGEDDIVRFEDTYGRSSV
ncbi:mannose-1-phosphate guanylyltransferase/mannose-6-phosphate isomerase [Hydrogenophaga sp. OTU3427]|uniref:mannose-1-phosphate guanylyltransferase/mannose-6-phosphate isomerase n=1 Tax=Hydrogenophaga sp. OTU3427 TaxID=3043856 RepID=UPI00313ED4CD